MLVTYAGWFVPCRISVFWGENAKRRHAKTRQIVTFSCFRPATRKYATFHALRFRLLFVVSLPGGAKGRHAKTCQNHHLADFCVAIFRPTMQRYDPFESGVYSSSICHVFAWRGERSPHENTSCAQQLHTVTHPMSMASNDSTLNQNKYAKMEDKNTTLKTWRVFAWRPFCVFKLPCKQNYNYMYVY